MKNILSKIPSFIYSLIVLCVILITLISYILNNLEPESHSSKIIFTLIIFVTTLLFIPTSKTIFLVFEEENTDLRARFRYFFGENVFFSLFFSILFLFKTYELINFSSLLTVIFLYIIVSFIYKKLRKPRRIKRI